MTMKLLPHKWQKVGVAALIASLLAATVLILLVLKGISTGQLFTAAVLIGLYFSVFCLLFSQEKQENEDTRRFRLQSAGICILLTLSALLLMNLIHCFLPEDLYQAFLSWRQDHLWNGNYLVYLALLYWVIFKIKVSRYFRQQNNL